MKVTEEIRCAGGLMPHDPIFIHTMLLWETLQCVLKTGIAGAAPELHQLQLDT